MVLADRSVHGMRLELSPFQVHFSTLCRRAATFSACLLSRNLRATAIQASDYIVYVFVTSVFFNVV